jgi:hypothetical protein
MYNIINVYGHGVISASSYQDSPPSKCVVHGEADVKIDDHTQELNTAVTRLYNLIGTTSLKVKRL